MAMRRGLWWLGLCLPTAVAYGAWAQPAPPPSAAPPAPSVTPSAAPRGAPPAASAQEEDPPPPVPAPSATSRRPAAPPPTTLPPTTLPPTTLPPTTLPPRTPQPTTPPPRTPPQPPQGWPTPAPPHPYGYGYGYGAPYGYGYRYRAPELPRRIPFRADRPAPPGYQLDTQLRKGFVIAGAVTFGATWLLSAAVGAALIQESDGDGFAPLFVPVVGPFITTGTVDASAFGTFALVVDGLAQTVGLGMFIFGVVDPEKVWVRPQVAVDVTPLFVDGEPAGVGLTGRF